MFIVWCRWCHAQDLPDNHYRSWLPLKADLPSRLPNFFIHFRPCELNAQAEEHAGGRQCLVAASPLRAQQLHPVKAGSGSGVSQSAPGKALKVHHGQTFSLLLKFLLMPSASVLTVNSHLKQPCATELSARDVSEPHRPFKILPWLKGHQSARRDPYLWVRSLREIHSITFIFIFWGGYFYSSVTTQKSLKAKKIRSGCAKGRESTDCIPERRLCPEPTTITQMLMTSSKLADGVWGSWAFFKSPYFTEWGHFQPS